MVKLESASVQPHPSVSSFAKKAIDVGLSSCALLVLSPLMVIIGISIKATSRGPVFYRRTVQGYGGGTFFVFKFRSMIENAHELMKADAGLLAQYQANLKIVRDPRVTPLGRFLRKTSLDELPQFINVLRGEMSLVGPRMLGDIEFAKYGQWQNKVRSVRPGITGLWQIGGRHRTSFEERIRLDMHYIDHWSIRLDLMILLRTPFAVLAMAGAH